MIIGLATLVSLVLALASLAWRLVVMMREHLAARGDAGRQRVHWDEDCACCNAGCGEADDGNVCLLCGH